MRDLLDSDGINRFGPKRVWVVKNAYLQYQFSIEQGDLIWLDRGWYVTHTGLIRLARRNRCTGIHTKPIGDFCIPQSQHWAFEATVYRTKTCRGFVGYGDADPSNVSYLVQGAEMRVAETRAVNRALRKAYGIGICSVEEIGSLDRQVPPAPADAKKLPSTSQWQWNRQPHRPRPALSGHSPAQSGSQPRQGLCR